MGISLAVKTQGRLFDSPRNFPRWAGRLNITSEQAVELFEGLQFVELCLTQKKNGLAAETVEDLLESFETSPSLLTKIVLMELHESFLASEKSDVNLISLASLKVRARLCIKSKSTEVALS